MRATPASAARCWSLWKRARSAEAYLAGHHETALPAAIASGLLFAGACGLFVFVRGLDRRSRRR